MSEIQVQTAAGTKAGDELLYSEVKKRSFELPAETLTGEKASDELFYYKRSSSRAGSVAGSSAGSHGSYR